MNPFITTVQLDYIRRTKNYSFLITACISLALAYTFVPEPNASYQTIVIADYVGYYNSAWFGYVTATMTSIFLALLGFYLVVSSIKNESNAHFGQVIASSSMSNFKYLLSKALSNFLILLTIVLLVLFMSIVLFLLYNDGFPFEISQFIIPYAIVTIPTMFCIAALAVIFEVMLYRYPILQYIGFFILFSVLLASSSRDSSEFYTDLTGTQIVMNNMEESVQTILQTDDPIDMTIGFVIRDSIEPKKFNFNGIGFPFLFIISRFLWMGISVFLVLLCALRFHRFDSVNYKSGNRSKSDDIDQQGNKAISITNLPKAVMNYSIFPIFISEFLMLIRKGSKWFWLLNIVGMGLLAFLPIQTAHQFVLPILFFLQVHRLSDITVKESLYNTRFLTFTSFKPLTRVLISQISAAIVLMLFLASPLLIRLVYDLHSIGTIIIGSILLVFAASALGLFSKSKKLFEVLFFMISYAIINSISFFDYLGGINHSYGHIIALSFIMIVAVALTFCYRFYELKSS